MIKIDAKGKVCPLPIIMLKNAINDNENFDVIKIEVSDKIAVENTEKFLLDRNYDYNYEKFQNFYVISIHNKKNNKINDNSSRNNIVLDSTNTNNLKGEYILVCNTNEMGIGNEVLGKKLIQTFIYTISEQENLPIEVIFYNKGVFLATEDSKNIKDLEKMKSLGVKISVCGVCLDFYNLKDKVKIADITNMYDITEKLIKYKVVRP